MIITNRDIELLKEHNKKVRMTVKLLDSETYQEVDSIMGNIVSGSYDKTYDSDIRVTCSLVLSVLDKQQILPNFKKTWNKRMVELHCGIYDNSINSYRDYNLGRLLMKSGSATYNINTQEIKLDLVDLMASMTQERGSQVGSDTYIPATEEGVNVRSVIISIIDNFATFKRYDICEFDDTIPYDLTFNNGIYPIEMLKKILELFPLYEMFYDNDGTFITQKIPTNVSDPIYIDSDIIDDLLIGESTTSDFSEIRNTTEIWGRELDCDYAAISCVQTSGVYVVNIDSSFETLVDGETFAVMPSANSVANQKMNIQNLGEYGVYTMSGAGEYTQIGANDMVADIPYQIRYFQNKYILAGELQIRCIVQEIIQEPSASAKQYYMEQNNCRNVEWIVNPDSTYACTIAPTTGRITGEIKQVLSDGEYADIYSTQLAYERAEYENWLSCRLKDTVEFQCILIPWINVNTKIRYTSPMTGEIETWIVQSFSFDFANWTMDVKASRFFPNYPWEE